MLSNVIVVVVDKNRGGVEEQIVVCIMTADCLPIIMPWPQNSNVVQSPETGE